MSRNHHKKHKKQTAGSNKKAVSKQKGSGFKTFTSVGALVLVFSLVAGMLAMYAL